MIGSIGVISGELGRYVDFYASLAQVAMPEGTQMIWSKGTSIPENCNGCIRRAQDWASAVDGPREDDWVWILGDDHMMPADSLVRLLAHDVDIVAPLGLRRRPPYAPAIYQRDEGNGLVQYENLPTRGLVEVAAAGSAGMLVRRRVWEGMTDPWFETFGETMCEDLVFCSRATQAGFKIYVDLDVRFGHMTNNVVWPKIVGDKWAVGMDLGGGNGVVLDAHATPNPERKELTYAR